MQRERAFNLATRTHAAGHYEELSIKQRVFCLAPETGP